LAGPTISYKCCYSSSNESTPGTWQAGKIIDNKDQGKPERGQYHVSYLKLRYRCSWKMIGLFHLFKTFFLSNRRLTNLVHISFNHAFVSVQHENLTSLPHMSILVAFLMLSSWSSNSVESVLAVLFGVKMKSCIWDLFPLMEGKRLYHASLSFHSLLLSSFSISSFLLCSFLIFPCSSTNIVLLVLYQTDN